MAANEKEKTKKTYHSPKMIEYGDIRDLTEQNAGGSGKQDNPTYTSYRTGT